MQVGIAKCLLISLHHQHKNAAKFFQFEFSKANIRTERVPRVALRLHNLNGRACSTFIQCSSMVKFLANNYQMLYGPLLQDDFLTFFRTACFINIPLPFFLHVAVKKKPRFGCNVTGLLSAKNVSRHNFVTCWYVFYLPCD